jgi:hypothetical protein
VAEGVVDISHEGLRVLLRAEGVTFQRLKTWKTSKDPHYQEKKARIEELYAIADRQASPQAGDPEVVFCVDEFGPLNLQPHPGPHLSTAKDARVGTWGDGEQRRDRLHADELVLVKPHRGPVHSAAVLRARRHRPRQPRGTSPDDPPGTSSGATTTPTTNDSAASSTAQAQLDAAPARASGRV